MKHKKELGILSLIAITIIGILSGASYAYFQVQQKQGQETVIESGTMALTLEDGATITADNLIPGEYIEKEFTVKNTGTLKTGYDIYLSEVVNTFVNQSDLVYEIISSNGYNTSNQVQVPNTETKIINNYNINPLEEHKYILKITYKLTNENQNDNMGRGFTAKININEYTTNNSEHLLKLLDTSNNIVDKQIISSGITDYYYNLANTSLTGTTNIYCNNGGIPTIESNILKVSDITNDTECNISNDIVDTFTNKLSTTKTGIVMTNNQDNTTRLLVPASKEVVFDLNGKTINSAGLNLASGTWNENYVGVRVYGIITINDTVGTGSINTGINEPVIAMNSDGELVVNGGYFNGKCSLFNAASNTSMEINGGTFDTKVGANIDIQGDNNRLVVNDITVNHSKDSKAVFAIGGGSSNIVNFNNGSININEGAWLFTTRENFAGTININNGNFSNTATGLVGLRNGTLNINGGKFNSPNYYVVHTVDGLSGTLNINGGNYTSRSCTICNNGSSHVVNINDGVFESTYSEVILNNGGVFNINGSRATFDSNGNYVSGIYMHNMNTDSPKYLMSNFGDLTIHNGTFRSKYASIINLGGKANIYDGDFVVSEGTGEDIKFLSAAIINAKPYSGTINLYGGTFESKTGYGIRRNGPGTINIYNANVKSYDYDAINGTCDDCNEGSINICKVNLINNKTVYGGFGNTYYHTNAFGSVTPTFAGTTANIQVKDSVCD